MKITIEVHESIADRLMNIISALEAYVSANVKLSQNGDPKEQVFRVKMSK
jgi:hypothetical protein